MKLSFIIPVFNEESTVYEILRRVCNANYGKDISKEIIIVNDGSTDNSKNLIEKFIIENTQNNINFLENNQNLGKGTSIKKALEYVNGEFVIIQDADLECDPDEINLLLDPIKKGFADVVYGSRYRGGFAHRKLFFWHSVGNRFLTKLSNLFTNLNLTDMGTCYKLIKTDYLKGIKIKEKRFGFDPEVTAKISKIKGIRLYEVGVSYYGRNFNEGKKVSFKDGFRAIWCIIRYNLFK